MINIITKIEKETGCTVDAHCVGSQTSDTIIRVHYGDNPRNIAYLYLLDNEPVNGFVKDKICYDLNSFICEVNNDKENN